MNHVEVSGWVKYCTGCNHADFLHSSTEVCRGISCSCPSFVETACVVVPVDHVNHPPHYRKHPSGVECIVITEHMNFCLGSAMKYIWRAGEKGDLIQDLQKAKWFLDREIQRLEKFSK